MDTSQLAISTTTHETYFSNALNGLKQLDDETIDLTVTSPPYPMIEMWDEVFASISTETKKALQNDDYDTAYEEMHTSLNEIWNEVIRVTKPNRIIAINIGNATRRTNNTFKLYPNIQPIINYFTNNGCEMLPFIHWNKESNKSSSFMGSGTIPTNAYVTNDHEYILLFRKGNGTRDFPPNHTKRYQSGFFWEERNTWFSDRWTFKGQNQALIESETRDRSGAFPETLPYRLINMYSIYGDTVLDPFLGTGTTQHVASILGRNSIGIEIDPQLKETIKQPLATLPTHSQELLHSRVESHLQFAKNNTTEYTSEYGPVKTSYEQHIVLPITTNTTIKDETDSKLIWETTLKKYTHNTT